MPTRKQRAKDKYAAAKARITELEELIFELGEKGPHLNGCAKLVKGGWFCDDRCLVQVCQKIFDSRELTDERYDELSFKLMPRGIPGTGQVCGAANDCTRLKGHEGDHFNHYNRRRW